MLISLESFFVLLVGIKILPGGWIDAEHFADLSFENIDFITSFDFRSYNWAELQKHSVSDQGRGFRLFITPSNRNTRIYVSSQWEEVESSAMFQIGFLFHLIEESMCRVPVLDLKIQKCKQPLSIS